MEILLFIGVLVAVGVIGWLVWYVGHKRREAFRAFAGQHGLEYSHEDPFGTVGLPFALFRRGEGRKVENVLWGEWRGEECRAFDYWYYTESTDSKGNKSRTYHRFTCTLLEVDADFPALSIGRENVFTRLADGMGFRDIQFESPDFNRRFQVKAKDKRFAYELIDASLMQWMTGLQLPVMFEVVGRWTLAFVKKRFPPEGFVPVIEVARDFRRRIPRVAWSHYGRTRQTASEGEERS